MFLTRYAHVLFFAVNVVALEAQNPLPDSLQLKIDAAKNDSQKVDALLTAGEHYYSLFTTEGYSIAASYYQKALNVALVKKPEPLHSYCYLSLGQIYDALGEPEDLAKALYFYEKYYENILASKQDTEHQFGALQFLSSVQFRLKLKEAGLKSLEKLLFIADNWQGETQARHSAYAYAAFNMAKLKDYARAKDYLNTLNLDESHAKKLGNYTFKNYMLAQLYIANHEKDHSKIAILGQKLLADVTKKTDSLEIADLLGTMLGDQKDYATAYQYQELEHKLYEEIVKEKPLTDVNNRLLKSELALKEENERLQKTQNRFLLGGLMLLTLSLLPLLRLYFLNKTKRRVLAEQVNRNNILLQEVHHRVKNNLQLINSFMFLQQAKSNVTQDALIKEMQSKIGALSLVHQMLHAGQRFDEVELRGYFEQLLTLILEIHDPKNTDFDYKLDVVSSTLPIEKVTALSFLTIELILNTLKHVLPHQSQTRIEISMTFVERTIYFRYADNGVGLPTGVGFDAPKTTGLRLIKRLAGQLKAEIKTESSPQGWVFMLKIPVSVP